MGGIFQGIEEGGKLAKTGLEIGEAAGKMLQETQEGQRALGALGKGVEAGERLLEPVTEAAEKYKPIKDLIARLHSATSVFERTGEGLKEPKILLDGRLDKTTIVLPKDATVAAKGEARMSAAFARLVFENQDLAEAAQSSQPSKLQQSMNRADHAVHGAFAYVRGATQDYNLFSHKLSALYGEFSAEARTLGLKLALDAPESGKIDGEIGELIASANRSALADSQFIRSTAATRGALANPEVLKLPLWQRAAAVRAVARYATEVAGGQAETAGAKVALANPEVLKLPAWQETIGRIARNMDGKTVQKLAEEQLAIESSPVAQTNVRLIDFSKSAGNPFTSVEPSSVPSPFPGIEGASRGFRLRPLNDGGANPRIRSLFENVRTGFGRVRKPDGLSSFGRVGATRMVGTVAETKNVSW